MPYYNPMQLWNGSYGQKAGADVYGKRVAPITMPNPAGDLAKQFPNLTEANKSASDFINSQLKGQLGPDTMDAIKNAGAAWGFQTGVPASQFAENNTLRNLGLTKIAVQNQGLQNLNQTLPVTSQTQTVSPELQADINFQNNVSAAAPDPTSSGSYAQALFQKYLSNLRGSTPQQDMLNEERQGQVFYDGSWHRVGDRWTVN